MKYILSFLIVFLVSNIGLAKPIPISGKLLRLDNSAVESSFVKFNIKIQNLGNCVIYEEEQNLDLTGSKGYFKFSLGEGSTIYSPLGFSIFGNQTFSCKDGGNWVGQASDSRRIMISVKIDDEPWVDFGSDVLNATPYSNNSELLSGKRVQDFIQVQGSTDQAKIDDLAIRRDDIVALVNGTSTLYAKNLDLASALNAKQDRLSFTPLNPLNNLSDVSSVSQARINLGLGPLAIKNQVNNADIQNVDWSKLLNVPSTFTPSIHSHSINDINGLTALIDTKVSKSIFTCNSSQVIQYISLTDTFSCVNISVSLSGDVTGAVTSNTVSRIQGRDVVISNPLNNDVLTLDTVQNRIVNKAVSSRFPAEVITMSASTCPAGTLQANGSAISRSTYPALFLAMGTIHGEGDGSTTFNLPDYRGRFLRMVDLGAGRDPDRSTRSAMNTGGVTGDNVGSTQNDEFRSHTHSVNVGGPGADSNSPSRGNFADRATGSSGASGGSETRPKNANVIYCVVTGI